MPITKYQVYYRKLKDILNSIKDREEYSNDSLAFAHWFLKHQVGLDDQQIGEVIIDGDGDYGIDAVYLNDKKLHVYQFKFPTEKNINKEIEQGDILKTFNGYDMLVDSKHKLRKANKSFMAMKEYLRDEAVYEFEINFVSYNKGIKSNVEVLENRSSKYKDDYEFNYKLYDRDTILNIFEKSQRNTSVDVKLTYKNMTNSYAGENIESSVGVVNATKLVEAVKDELSVVFDENIRLYESDSKVNEGIYKTAIGNDTSGMFYYYNNGITFICDDYKNSPNNNSLFMKGASIVNGCQTVTTLARAYDDSKLREDADLLVRVIKIKKYSERAKITKYLNSQTQIKESYFIANHPIVRDLQEDLLKDNYYLERQTNELSHKQKYDSEYLKGKELQVLNLSDVIQRYTGYYVDKYAHIAKSGKGALFENDNIEEILGGINAEKAIKSFEVYEKISSIITLYRRMRRNNEKNDFLRYLGVKKEEFVFNEYLFVNTTDILLLNTVHKLSELDESANINTLIKIGILIIRDIIKNNDNYKQTPPATLMKRKAVYESVRKYIEENKELLKTMLQ